MKKKELGIYVHIPFCVKKCRYCDFLSFGKSKQMGDRYSAYVKAVCREIQGYAALARQYQVSTIYFGGGTPSILEVHLIGEILDIIRNVFTMTEDVEITIECNPGTTDYEKFHIYRQLGINRLSLGLQSTNDEMLRRLGRIHTYEDFLVQYKDARKAGFTNINVDLMSALPGQNLEQYQKDVETVVALGPEHISSYSLILEEGTPFFEDSRIRQQLPDEDMAVAMYEHTKDWLAKAGYHRYEISNYSMPGKESRHNSSYWAGTSYLGIGLGASSYLAEWEGLPLILEGKPECIVDNQLKYYTRFRNESHLLTYIKNQQELLLNGNIMKPFVQLQHTWEELEILSLTDRMEEFMFLGMRMMKGVSREEFQMRFGRSMEEIYGEIIKGYKVQGLIKEYEKQGQHFITLTDDGINISNMIFADFLLE